MDVLGFTGTQNGMTVLQKIGFVDVLLALRPAMFCHGDCEGADEQAHAFVRAYLPDCSIHIFPPLDDSKRAFCAGDFVHEPEPYLKRNRAIVDRSSIVVGTPKTAFEIRRSGTWATLRYARQKRPRTTFVLPPQCSNTYIETLITEIKIERARCESAQRRR